MFCAEMLKIAIQGGYRVNGAEVAKLRSQKEGYEFSDAVKAGKGRCWPFDYSYYIEKTDKPNWRRIMNKKHLTLGILAHVDAGKTTLAEGILFQSGSIRKLGRVDHGSAFLDTYALEQKRGITIFSKQAEFTLEHRSVTLLDTPGHIDFSAEMERTLQVLDYAVLVISGADGVQGHVGTLWRLLEHYQVPVFIFINKMDQQGTDRAALLSGLRQKFGEGCVDFSGDLESSGGWKILRCAVKSFWKNFWKREVLKKTISDGPLQGVTHFHVISVQP